jgi:ParB family chromosome partitioning protein
MAKQADLMSRIGGDLAASMGAARSGMPSGIVPGGASAMPAGRNAGVGRLRGAAEIAVDRCVPDPDQPRTEFDPEAIARLAASIARHGQIAPVAVRYSEALDRFVLIAGERRYRAAIAAGRPTIAAVILDGGHDEMQLLRLGLVENCIREDLKPIEQARAFRKLMDSEGCSALALAESLQMSESTILKAVALLDLPADVRDAVEGGKLAPSVAYEVSKADPGEQAAIAAHVVAEGLNRAETIRAVRESAGRAPRAPKGRGAGKGKAGEKLPTIRKHRATSGVKLVAESRKGIDVATLAAGLREWLAAIEGRGGDARDDASGAQEAA